MLEDTSGISYSIGDSIFPFAPAPERFDAVVGCPPLGDKARHILHFHLADSVVDLKGALGNITLFASCLSLQHDGIGVFIVPNTFLGAKKDRSARGMLERYGIRVCAAIELPAGALHPLTAISTHIVVLRRTTDDTIFTGRYSGDLDHQLALLENLHTRTNGKLVSQGRLVPTGSFRGFSDYERADSINTLAQHMGLVPVPFSSVVVEINSQTSRHDFTRFEERSNSVYLPQVASADATMTQAALPERLKSYLQLVVNPEVADAEYVAGLLNTELGQMVRDSVMEGDIIPRITKRLLRQVNLYLPPSHLWEVQKRTVETHQAIGRLRNELNELETQLWQRPLDVDKTQAALHALNREENREERFQDWIDSLPFPLASILWVCHAESGKYRERYERQISFFEALAEYMAVLYLSAFSSNSGLWCEVRPKLQESLAKNSLSLEMATFGTWRVVVEVLGAQARRLLNGNSDMCYELFRTRNRVVVDRITSKKLVGILQDSNAIRNRWTGHTGAVSETAAREVYGKLNQHIFTVREIFGTIWESYEVLLPSVCKMRDGSFCYSAKRIMGSRTPFQSIEVQLSEGMEDGQLHLWSPAESRTLKLLPLIKASENN